jgi:predicted permease
MTALGFIVLTFGGNIWLIYLLTGDPAPNWLVSFFNLGLFLVMAGGVGMMIWKFLHRNDPEEEDEETTEYDGPDGGSEEART